SVSSIGRSAAVHAGNPSPPGWQTGWPEARRSSGWYGVTHKLWVAKVARRPIGVSGPASSVGAVPGSSRYATGWPTPFVLDGLTTFHDRTRLASASRRAANSV